MSAVDRIVADNDPRNGTVAQRLVRMIEQPDREPNDDGLYPEDPRIEREEYEREHGFGPDEADRQAEREHRR